MESDVSGLTKLNITPPVLLVLQINRCQKLFFWEFCAVELSSCSICTRGKHKNTGSKREENMAVDASRPSQCVHVASEFISG